MSNNPGQSRNSFRNIFECISSDAYKRYAQPRVLVFMAVLIALQVVCTKVIAVQYISQRFSPLGILPTAVGGMLLGPVSAAIIRSMADLLGAFLYGAVPWPEMTLNYVLLGFVTGLFYFQKPITLLRSVMCNLFVTVVCFMLINTLILTTRNHTVFWAELLVRLPKYAFQYPADVILVLAAGSMIKRLPASLTRI